MTDPRGDDKTTPSQRDWPASDRRPAPGSDPLTDAEPGGDDGGAAGPGLAPVLPLRRRPSGGLTDADADADADADREDGAIAGPDETPAPDPALPARRRSGFGAAGRARSADDPPPGDADDEDAQEASAAGGYPAAAGYNDGGSYGAGRPSPGDGRADGGYSGYSGYSGQADPDGRGAGRDDSGAEPRGLIARGRALLSRGGGVPAPTDGGGRGVTVLDAPAGLLSSSGPDDLRPTVLVGAVILVLTFGVAGLWAALAPLDSAAHAPGRVIVESNRKTIQHLEGGIVAEIAVQEGNLVQEGDLLIRLDDTQARSSYARNRNQLDALLAQEARLIAERDGASEISFPEDLTSRAAEPEVAKVMRDQERQFVERRQSLDGQTAILEQRIFEGMQEIEGIYAQRDSKIKQVKIFKEELVGLRELYEKGYYARTRVLAMEREVARLEGDIGSHTAEIARAESTIGETRLQIMQTEQQFREKVVESLRDVRTNIADLRERLVVAEDIFDRLEIRAPLTGRVQSIRYHTIGGVIQAGQPILDIVPLDDRLIIEAQVSPTDIDDIHAGQSAEVRFTALSGRTTPSIFGQVMSVSADAITDDKSGHSYYLARIDIPVDELGKLQDNKLQAGMPAEVLINTGTRTALQYIVRPLTDAMSRGMIEK